MVGAEGEQVAAADNRARLEGTCDQLPSSVL